MSYSLNSVSIRTNNSDEGMKKIEEIWCDITSGKLPIIFDNENNFLLGVSPISKYSNYESNENGDYDLTILGVTADFFEKLESEVKKGTYKKYDESDENGDINICAKKAWQKVWTEQKNNIIKRKYTEDYESSVPAKYTKDGKAHCYLYIAVE